MVTSLEFVNGIKFYAGVLPKFAPNFEKQPSVATFWYKNLNIENVTKQEFKNAMDTICTTAITFPSLAEIKAALTGKSADPKARAAEISVRISSAIRRFGYCNPDDAQEYLGEDGWQVVESCGGWAYVCESATNDNLPTLQAQWRGVATTITRRRHSSDSEALPESVKNLLPKGIL